MSVILPTGRDPLVVASRTACADHPISSGTGPSLQLVGQPISEFHIVEEELFDTTGRESSSTARTQFFV
jgi:hypothetical protein